MTRRAALLALGAVCLFARPAAAHFELLAPPSYSEQDLLGGPQKSEPCGQADPGQPVVATNAVTTVMEGSQLAIQIDEKITHPGHYRVSIAADQASLPADPLVTPGSTACGTTVIESQPSLPLLADGLLVHTSAFSAPQTAMVQLPAGMTCDHCVVQVTEFMSDHGLNNPGGCFYHHCAVVTVAANAPGPDAGMPDAGVPDPGGTPGGCCDAHGSLAGSGLVALLVGAVLVARRRRAPA